MQTEGKSLAAKLVKVMEAVNFIPKNGRNQAQNYAYATDADISDTVRKAMAANRVVMLPKVTSHTVRQIQGRNGEININTVAMDFTFIDADTGESFTISTVGEGMDSGDKGCYKAQTGAVKYALLKSFQIPTGDDPEKDNGEEEHGTHSQLAAVKATAPQAAAASTPHISTASKPQTAPISQAAPKSAPLTIRNPGEPCTLKQQGRFFALAKAANLDLALLGQYMQRQYGVTQSSHLSKGQISEFMDGIESGRVGADLAVMAMGDEVAVGDEGAGA